MFDATFESPTRFCNLDRLLIVARFPLMLGLQGEIHRVGGELCISAPEMQGNERGRARHEPWMECMQIVKRKG